MKETPEEPLIKLETARLAKQKGFDWKCYWAYDRSWPTGRHTGYNNWNKFDLEKCSAPSQAQLQKWLREKHEIYIEIRRLAFGPDEGVWYYEYNPFIYPKGSEKHTDDGIGDEYDTYEDALEAALVYALNLIK